MIFEINYFFNYFIILCYILCSIVICVILANLAILLRFVMGVKPDSEISSPYECGFIPFDKIRYQMEIKFFVIGLLFVLFDLEIVIILPCALTILIFNLIIFYVLCFFIIILLISFVYELLEEGLNF